MNSILKPMLSLALVATVAACSQPASKNNTVPDPNAKMVGDAVSNPVAAAFNSGESRMGDQMMAAVGSAWRSSR